RPAGDVSPAGDRDFFRAVGCPPGGLSGDRQCQLASGTGPIELQQVVCRADQRPFSLDGIETAKHEPAEASRFLDLPEYGLWRELSLPVHLAPLLGSQLLRHLLLW